MRLRESSSPQLPPRQAMRTPLTRNTRCGEARRSVSSRTAADVSAPGMKEATHPSADSIIPSWLTFTTCRPILLATIGLKSTPAQIAAAVEQGQFITEFADAEAQAAAVGLALAVENLIFR
jgi:hypothetical protein